MVMQRKAQLVDRSTPGLFGAEKGTNHSVIIAVGCDRILSHEILVGNVKSNDKRKRGTKRIDFCRFLKRKVGPAMLRAAADNDLDDDQDLYLVMDNASIHKGELVSQSLRSNSSARLHIVYQPPYMPTIHPTELVNNQLKSKLKRLANQSFVDRLLLFNTESVNDDPEDGVIENNLSSLEKQRRSLLKDFYSKNAKDASDILIEAIEFLLDNDISLNDLNNYYKHCGWYEKEKKNATTTIK